MLEPPFDILEITAEMFVLLTFFLELHSIVLDKRC